MLTPEQQRRLRKKNAGRHYFEHWLRSEFPEWRWSWDYQRYVYQHLDKITKGRSRRLMIFMPPRHGKSEMVTVRYTAWRLMRDARLNVILASYNQRLADRFSRKVKRIVLTKGVEEERSEGEKEQGGKTSPLRPNSSTPLLRSASEWETPSGGVVRSAGVGAGIAGFGAGLVVIDDPVRNRADAESQTYRDRVWEWFSDDIYTRLEPEGSIILIQTRWHEDDLAGRLLKEMVDGGEQWDVVCLRALAEGDLSPRGKKRIAQGKAPGRDPGKQSRIESDPEGVAHSAADVAPLQGATDADADPGVPLASLTHPGLLSVSPSGTGMADPLGRKPGEALCPQRYGVETLERIRRKLGSYSFSALYQQRPSPAEGGMFKRAWFRRIVDQAPEGLRWKRGYDLAISTKTSADYTASFRCAKDAMGNIYIADGFRRRIEYPEQRRYIIERMLTEADTEHGIESALHGRALVQDIRRADGTLSKPLRSIHVEKDKLTRALAWLNLAEEGKLILVRGPWIDEFVEEIAAFPTGRHDDQIDAVSIAVSMLARTGYGFWTF